MKIIDASVLLRAFFPDEEGHPAALALLRAHVLGEEELHAPTLLAYEITNALVQGVRRERISPDTAQEILATFEGLGIPLHPAPLSRTLELARRFSRSAYDAAYLALAEAMDAPLITADLRLFHAVQAALPWVHRLGE